jgi:dTDP-4-amino-4,6-dideoxygalactose transaminase
MIGDEEKQEVMKVLDSGLLTTANIEGGKYVKKLQSAVESYLNVKYAVSVNSGTSAIYASLLALDIKQGDEVLLPSFTFLATANSVLMSGAKPVFVDIDLKHYTIDPEDLMKKITEKSRAIIPVHLYGHPAMMDEISEIADKYDLRIIEDAAQSLGSKIKGKYTGSLSDIGCFSLYPSKIITSGEGGIVTTNDKELANKLKMIRNHGMQKEYNSVILGSNLRMPEIEAAIATIQMSRLNKFIEGRRNNAKILTEILEDHNEISLPYEENDYVSNWSLYTVAVNNRDNVLEYLNSNNVGSAVYYKNPVHRVLLYRKKGFSGIDLSKTDWAAQHVLSLPIHPKVTGEDLETISSTLKQAINSI